MITADRGLELETSGLDQFGRARKVVVTENSCTIIEGAGGVVSHWNGDLITGEGNIVAAGDARVHAEAVKMLRR